MIGSLLFAVWIELAPQTAPVTVAVWGWVLRRGLRVLLEYLLWGLSSALSLLAVLQLRVFLFIDLPVVTILKRNPWMPTVIHYVGLGLLGILWLGFVAFSESYFRRWMRDKESRMNIVKVFVVEGLLFGLAYLGHQWIR